MKVMAFNNYFSSPEHHVREGGRGGEKESAKKSKKSNHTENFTI